MFRASIIVTVLALAALGRTQDRHTPATTLGRSEMILEWTPGGEAVVRMVAESEDDLAHVQIFRPDGRQLVELGPPGLRGLTALEFELREPDLAALQASYAEGSYVVRAATVGGGLALSTARLSFELPPSPVILHPVSGALVQVSNLTILWRQEPGASGYVLQLEQGEEDGLRVKLPPEQSSFRVPEGVLLPGLETTLEIAAIGSNGNRTLAETVFVTRP